MMALPCRHVFRCLVDNLMDAFDAKTCHRRWFKQYLPSDLIGDVPYIENEQAMTQAAKYRQANELLTDVAELFSNLQNIFGRSEKNARMHSTRMHLCCSGNR